ncbi:hypothetical protein OS493_036016 [Desmophyllum pertusum]|uniref:Uncharacterized protein n=1 Tax=Desmophyllum pertusum TaxID=174260 RepID=A0A9X0D0J5_9CNID|nr:hypothetical protein OS493_036016 [Desmophyllum pertusum]
MIYSKYTSQLGKDGFKNCYELVANRIRHHEHVYLRPKLKSSFFSFVSAMDDIESWLNVTEEDVTNAEAAAAQQAAEGDTLTTSEFDEFLADRAAAGGQRTGSVKSGVSRPRQRQMQMENEADDEMFGL